MKRLRIHPSVLAFWYSSDELPPTDVEEAYLGVFKTEKWPNPVLASASNLTSTITGPTGVKVRSLPARETWVHLLTCASMSASLVGSLQMSGPYGETTADVA